VREGTTHARYVGRRTIVLLAVVLAIAFLLWLAPE
jgi:hypothetical protein